ncbi:MAG: LysE family translocator [Hoeflea sp.]|uniref:LysE family translocator n=1 Tax=Hoeflea sp. TaxID=1940281 RepID=UPI0032F060B8
MEIGALLVFAGALIVAAGSPGPSIAALVARVIARGPADVLPFLAAMWIGEAVWLTLAVFGLAALAQSFNLVFMTLKWAGVVYLVYLAWKLWHAPVQVAADGLPDRGSALRLFAAGLAVTLGNPKIMVFYLALLPTIIDLGHLSLTAWFELTATMLAVLIMIDLLWVFLAARARKLLASPRALRAVNRCSSGLLAGAAAGIAAR